MKKIIIYKQKILILSKELANFQIFAGNGNLNMKKKLMNLIIDRSQIEKALNRKKINYKEK